MKIRHLLRHSKMYVDIMVTEKHLLHLNLSFTLASILASLHLTSPFLFLPYTRVSQILDVGCGGGLLCEPLARLGAEVTGIDPVEETVRVALMHALQDPDFGENLTYSCTTVELLNPDLAESFDAVVASEVIEHVPDPMEFAENCIRLIKPGICNTF